MRQVTTRSSERDSDQGCSTMHHLPAYGNVPPSQQQRQQEEERQEQAGGDEHNSPPHAIQDSLHLLDPGQQQAYNLAMSGENLFLTGGPGTGKSHTLRKIIAALHKKFGSGGVLVAAPTGVAALIAEGQTLHSKPGPGVPKGTTEAFGNMKSKSSFEFWRRIKCLVIDEISMVDAEFLDWYMSNVPEDIQLIFCGDFEQLPPVPDKQGSLCNADHLRNCVAAARRKDNNESREAACNADPAVDDPPSRMAAGWICRATRRLRCERPRASLPSSQCAGARHT